MVLIVYSGTDFSTTQVIEWLERFNGQYVVLNENTQIKSIAITPGRFVITTQEGTIDTNEIKSVFYRRGGKEILSYLFQNYKKYKQDNFKKFIYNESLVAFEYFWHILEQKIILCPYSTASVNKLKILELATKIGFNVPYTLITNDVNEIIDLMQNNPQKPFIIKSLGEQPFYHTNDNVSLFGYTYKTSLTDIEWMKCNKSLNMVQEYIEKKIEIRIVFLIDKTYSMGILSQNDIQTKVDFRRYNNEKPNRVFPVKLPRSIEKKIQAMCKQLNFSFASFDLIYGMDKKFHFLEVNPVGQYGMVSYPCNYYIDKEIAQHLIKRPNEMAL